jgi:hypothetical protein
MMMRLYGGPDLETSMSVEVEEVAPGVGRIVCPECGGQPHKYANLFPPELGIHQCLDCKGTGYVLVST